MGFIEFLCSCTPSPYFGVGPLTTLIVCRYCKSVNDYFTTLCPLKLCTRVIDDKTYKQIGVVKF